MASIVHEAKLNGFAGFASAVTGNTLERYGNIYDEHRHRIYSLAFYMTDSEMAAEDLMKNVFCRAFARAGEPTTEAIDTAFLTEVRELMPVGTLTLGAMPEATSMARRNVKRIVLERAVVQLPATERLLFLLHDVEGYEHGRISRLLGITESESQEGLHAARVSIREWVATHHE